MATCEGCCHLTGAMLNLAAEAADRARMGRLHLTKSETRFNTDKTITYLVLSKQLLLNHCHQNHILKHTGDSLGAVLMQDQVGGLRKPVAYASRRLDKHERNYPVFLAEMQAAVFGMEQFHHFLITGRFSLYTDHRPLCKLSSAST
jgi:hypothetical protein